MHPAVGGAVCTEACRFFTRDTGIPVFPFADCADGPSDFVVDPVGRVLQLHWAEDFYVADSVDGALVAIIRSERFRPLDDEIIAMLAAGGGAGSKAGTSSDS